MSNGDIMEELKRRYREGSVLMRLIYVNVAVFLAVHIVSLLFFLFTGKEHIGSYFALRRFGSTAELSSLATRPWSVISHMFLHLGIWHIFFNMLVFYFAGTIFLQYLGQKRMLALYFLGGIGGFFLFLLSYNIFPAFQDEVSSDILGASAAVMAIFIGIATYKPNFEVQLLFIPIPIQLKWIAGIYVLIDFLSIQGPNSGGHIAHLGGALIGFLTINRIKQGNTDLLMRFQRFLTDIPEALGFGSKPKMKVKYRSKKAKSGTERARYMTDEQYNASKKAEQEEIDKILDKISKSGYESLTKKEKETLFRASKDK